MKWLINLHFEEPHGQKESHMWIETHSPCLKTTQLRDPRWVAKHKSELHFKEPVGQEEPQRTIKFKFT